MPIDPQALYAQLGRLTATVPQRNHRDYSATDDQIWLGRLHALVFEIGDADEIRILKNSIETLEGDIRIMNDNDVIAYHHAERRILGVLYRSLARAEMMAPSTAQGAFIPAGNAFDAMAAVGKVLTSARQDVLIIDPYMDEKALTDFAVLTPAGVGIRLLADQRHVYASLTPAAHRWVTQHGASRPLEVRLASARTLHDRLIVVDDANVWILTQSLNAFASRSPASIERSGDDTAALKVDAYRDMWANATPV